MMNGNRLKQVASYRYGRIVPVTGALSIGLRV